CSSYRSGSTFLF
nr:immunoglobulin light chain junction region [Macaca mulatta]MPO05298.1 immunoglobulin light chain junction region [Macaca mulatta]MPO06965.1 immunoglobulin light chain junction region [Macaca mulatta]MPO09364.1 immunoglobulin light chain junction region [Macaca mulatta]MPO10424.1 immunoglobulin light chain junction region [Macaca mulatta]